LAEWENEPSIQPDKWSVETAFKHYSNGFQKAVENVYAKEISEGNTTQAELFKANVTRFAACKAAKCNNLIDRDADKPADSRLGREKLIKTFDCWQHAEEQMVTRRARRAKRWEEIEEQGAPNVKWLPSISIERRAEHIPYYNQIFPGDSDIWDKQDIWGCKCSMAGTYRRETKHEWTDENGEKQPLPELKPSRGLEGNPARTGEIFTGRASYFREQPAESEIAGVANSGWLFRSPQEWRMDYFTEDRGVLITERERIKSGQLNVHEKEKFAKEWNMCSVLANNGQKVEFLAERAGEYDILYNGKPTDLKKTKSHNHIIEYAQKAIQRQGADYVIFEFEAFNDRIKQKLLWLASNGYKGRVIYYVTGENKLNRL
jgi:hypothetical protein